MSLLSDNIRYLRSQRKESQQYVSTQLNITRGRYAKYEEGVSEPPVVLLSRISHYFHVSVDLMISVDLRKVPIGELLKLEDNRILLPIMVDAQHNNFIEIIPHKAQAGYLHGYSDPEFIESLEQISLPFLGSGKYRAFPIQGDSMPPHQNGAFVIGRYLESLSEIKDGKTYVLVTQQEGIVYKRVYRLSAGQFELHSDNSFYSPYIIQASDILEVWQYASSIATHEFEPQDLAQADTKAMFQEIKQMISSLNSKGK